MPNKIVDPDKRAPESLDEEILSLDDELPEKYRGKSAVEIATMHMEAEKALSRQGQTVGEQRKVIDQFIQLQLDKSNENKHEGSKPLTADALFENPDQAIGNKVDSVVGSRVKNLEQDLLTVKRQAEQSKFESKHPGVVETIQDPAFQNWVRASNARIRLAQQLDSFDFSAGDDLLSLWKDYQEVSEIKNRKEESTRKRQQSLRDASTEGGSAGGEISPKKTYSRMEISDIMTRARAGDKEARAKAENPEWQAMIRRAYAEGRVK